MEIFVLRIPRHSCPLALAYGKKGCLDGFHKDNIEARINAKLFEHIEA